jgi:peptidoglycan/LPS O-acetylase OafA/YrhL
MNRRHDIDALRALAFAMVIVYHVGMYYVADWHWHIKSPHAAEWLQWPMRALNLWRMDLVFLISGIAFGFLRQGHTLQRLMGARSLRLLLPLAFGMAVVVPYQAYVQALDQGVIGPGFAAFLARYFTGGPWPKGAFDGSDFGVTWNHLWYLPYLWAYTMVLALLSPALDSAPGQWLRRAFTGLRGAALLGLPVLPLALYSITLWPRFPPTHDLIHDAWLHAVYFTLFLYGHWLGVHAGLWTALRRLRWIALVLAVGAFAGHVGLRTTLAGSDPVWRLAARLVADVYLWTSLVAVLGWAHHTLNRPWPWLAWANESVYPWYVLHQTLIIGLAVLLAPLALGPVLEPLLLLLGTALGCWVLTDALVRRINWLRPLFGLKPRARPPRPHPASPAHPAGRNA